MVLKYFCVASVTKQSSTVKGKILGSRYKILEYLAQGGFGRTYLAEDTQLPGQDVCVVKQLYPSSQSPRFLEVARRLFKTEASVLHNLGHHLQIPELLAYFEEESKFYLVQQYIEGHTLATELEDERIWTEVEVVELLQDVLHVLQFIHSKGVIHRDIKPDNLIRRQSDRKLVLVDFGTVKQVLQGEQTNLGQLTVAVGTQGYMPTEQARGKPRPTSDIYALGMIAIQALTGIAPINLEEDDEGEIIWQPLANVSSGLEEILSQMTRYHFKDRISSPAEILQNLTKLPSSNATKPQSVTAIYPDTTQTSNQDSTQFIANSIAQNSSPVTSTNNNSPTSEVSSTISAIQQTPAASGIESISQVNPPAPVELQKKNKLGIIIVSIVGALAAIASAYFIIQKPIPESEIELPAQGDNSPENSAVEESESFPTNPTERIPQGSGFREDI